MKRSSLQANVGGKANDSTKQIKRSVTEFAREIGVPQTTLSSWRREDPSFPKVAFVTKCIEFFVYSELKTYWKAKKENYKSKVTVS